MTAQTETPQRGVAEPDGSPEGATTQATRRADHGDRSPASPVTGRLATIVAVAVMAVYIGALWLLFANRADANWDRMVYLLSGYEVIVFVAVGALFGTTVQRASVRTAHAHERQARADAQSERDRANVAISRGERGNALAASVRSFAKSRARSPARPVRGNGEREGIRGPDEGVRGTRPGSDESELDFLIQLCDELFPQDG